MADFIIITMLAIIVFFIIRSQLHRLRRGECVGGCAGCSGCSHCQSGSGSANLDPKAE